MLGLADQNQLDFPRTLMKKFAGRKNDHQG
jgi:hypothetical protein